MRIAHICLASSYTEGLNYQDNLLPAQNRADGHEVLIVSNCSCYISGALTEVQPEDKFLKDGTRLIRLPFHGRFIPKFLRDKLRIASKLKNILNTFRPDIILYHGVVGFELLTVGAYKKCHGNSKLYLDSHQDLNNSGLTTLSRTLQYRVLTRLLWLCIMKYVDKVLYVSYESRDFLREIIRIPESQMEFFPLGGYVHETLVRTAIRERVRAEVKFSEEDTVFIHAGKFDRSKRTVETIRAFSKTQNPSYRLLIVGTFNNEIHPEAIKLMAADSRIFFLGWKTGEVLTELLCASDAYLQPGTQSATLQMALCCGLPVVIYPYASHKPYLEGNGYFVKTEEDIYSAMQELGASDRRLAMSLSSLSIANRILDYRKLAQRLYQ